MRYLLFYTYLLTFSTLTFSQPNSKDSVKLFNEKLDSQMNEEIKFYEDKGFDFLIFRVYDSVNVAVNQFTVMIRKDSCTNKYRLAFDYDYSIKHIYISDIAYYNPNDKCSDQLSVIASDLIEFEEAFNDSITTPLSFRNSNFTLYGKFGEKYLLEYFNQEFLSKYHSGSLYHTTLCFYFYHECER